jgi:hypothetical protein
VCQVRGFAACFSSRHSDGSIISTHHRHWQRAFVVRWLLPRQNHSLFESLVHRRPLWWLEPRPHGGRFRCHHHELHPRWVIISAAGTDRGLCRGVPHGSRSRWGRKDPPPFSMEAWHGGSTRTSHDCTTTREPSGRSRYSNYTPMAGDATVGHRPPP